MRLGKRDENAGTAAVVVVVVVVLWNATWCTGGALALAPSIFLALAHFSFPLFVVVVVVIVPVLT